MDLDPNPIASKEHFMTYLGWVGRELNLGCPAEMTMTLNPMAFKENFMKRAHAAGTGVSFIKLEESVNVRKLTFFFRLLSLSFLFLCFF